MTPRTLRWVLVGSLVVNLLFVGWVVGSWALHRPPVFGTRMIERLAEMAPGDTRPAIRMIIDSRAEEVRAAREAVRAARVEVDAALSADPFDRAAAEAAFARLQDRIGAMTGLVQETLLDVAETLPPETRARLTELRGR